MRTSMFFCFVILWLCNACKSEIDAGQTINPEEVKQEAEKLNAYMKGFEQAPQVFFVSSKKPSKVKGKKGTELSLNPEDLQTIDGKPPGKKIKIELKELLNQRALLRENAPTTSNGRLLVSGGAYYIHLSSGEKPLFLKKGRFLKAKFPRISSKKMSLFYGKRDSLGNLNWNETKAKFVTDRSLRDNVLTPNLGELEMKDDSEYQEVVDSSGARSRVYFDKNKSNGDMKNAIILSMDKDEIQVQAIDQLFYEEIALSELGWINCDRFSDVQEKTRLSYRFNPEDSIKFASVYLVFKQFNSVMKNDYYKNSKFNSSLSFDNIPLGTKVKLIAVSTQNGIPFCFEDDFKVSEDALIQLKLKKTDEKKLAKIFR